MAIVRVFFPALRWWLSRQAAPPPDPGGGAAGQPIGLLLALTKAS